MVESWGRHWSAGVVEDSTGCRDYRRCNRNPSKILHGSNSFHPSQRCVRTTLLYSQVTRQTLSLAQSSSSEPSVHGTRVSRGLKKSHSVPDLFSRLTELADRNS